MSKADKARARAEAAVAHLQNARARCKRAADFSKAAGGPSAVLVSLSGGKDSLVTLDLCCQAYERVEAFYMYLVPGIELFERPVDDAARRHGIVVHKVPHWDLARMVKHAVLRPHVAGAEKIKEQNIRGVRDAMRAKTGIHWVAAGERATDSMQRRFYTRERDGVHDHRGYLYPVWDWLDSDIYGYMRARGIPVPDAGAFKQGRNSHGFTLEPAQLSWLKTTHPDDYARVLTVFPYADADVLRWEAQQLSEVRVPTTRPPRAAKRPVQPEAPGLVQAGEAAEEPA